MRHTLFGFALFLVACGSASTDPSATSTSGSPSEGFDASPPPDGYTRYVTTAVDVKPGTSPLYLQWVAAPFDQDMDVVDIDGQQTETGHHAILYAATNAQPVGTTKSFENEDQLDLKFLGGVGGEAGAAIKLPAGLVFRIPKGSSLVIQTHYLNTTTDTVHAQSSIDVKLAPASKANTVASIFASTTLGFDLVPHAQTTAKMDCTVPHDVPFIMWSNHMHSYGTKVVTTQVMGGDTTDVKRDDAWNQEWAFDPNYTNFTQDAPAVIPQGATLHTECTWDNTGASAVKFPEEMCVFTGFVLGDKDITCLDNSWME